MTRDEFEKMLEENGIVSIDDDAAWRVAQLAVSAELESIMDAWWDAVQSDLEHGVKWLNEQASVEFSTNYPTISKFGAFLEKANEED